MKLKKSNIMVVLYIFLVVASIITILVFSIRCNEDDTVRVGFITTGDLGDAGWNAMNYRCVQEACRRMNAELLTISGVDDYGGHCKFAVDDMVSNGAGMIILNSPILAEQMKDMLHNYPDITFYGANADYEAANLTAYSCRMYQVRYLSGIVAGLYTKTNKIGFVASHKETSAFRGINAFALGAQSVNPDVEVLVSWTNSWENESEEKAAAQALIEDGGVDLLTYHQNKPYVIETAEKYGVASIGYYEPVEGVSEKFLTCAMCDWTIVYEKMLRGYVNGQSNASSSEWAGIESGAIKLTDFSPLVPKEASDRVDDAINRLIEGWHVFSGEIYDNNGTERCGDGEAISDNTLLYEMNWLVKGVTEYAY